MSTENKIIAILLFITMGIGFFFFASGTISLYNHWGEKPTPTNISVPCYDYSNHLIIGLTCEKNEYPNNGVGNFACGLFVLVLTFILWRLK